MTRLRKAIASGLVASCLGGAASDTGSAGATVFLRSLYDGYAPGHTAPNPTGRAAGRLFARPLLALIRADQALAAGEVGTLDEDPICACQDYDGLRQVHITVEPDGGMNARATVSFQNAGHQVTVRYRLGMSDGEWRIDDIAEPGMESLRRFLAAGIASLAKERAAE